MKLYRVMKIDVDGKPMVGTRRNMLGVRPTDPNNTIPNRKFDVDAVSGSDLVVPGKLKGLSVSTSTERLFPAPGEAVWQIEENELAPELLPCPAGPPHHILEPVRVINLDDYQGLLLATQDLWELVNEEG